LQNWQPERKSIAIRDTGDHVLRRYHITAEALREDIKQVAEGVRHLNEKFDREISQFRKEVTHSHDELKALMKFSYLELDRRITSLEIELENLKHRVEKIERGSPIS
jgi:predicted  nucleic acid-binding Zn-ribbon protein